MGVVAGEVEGQVALLSVSYWFASLCYEGSDCQGRGSGTYHRDGHDGWVGDVDCSFGVGSVGSVFAQEGELGDIEALQLVQSFILSVAFP